MNTKASRWFAHTLRVRYSETDQMGVVYHVNYLNWMEIGRTEFIRKLGIPYRDIEARGLLLPVVDLNIQYKQPARYDDTVTVYTKMKEFTPATIHFDYEIRRKTEQPGCEKSVKYDNPAADCKTTELDGYRAADLPVDGSDFPAGELLVTGSSRHVWVGEHWKPVRLSKEAPDIYSVLDTLLP